MHIVYICKTYPENHHSSTHQDVNSGYPEVIRFMDDFHFILYILIQCLEWNQMPLYTCKQQQKTLGFEQGRRKISRRSFSVTLVCFSAAGNQKFLFAPKMPPFSEGPSIPTVVKHLVSIFPGTHWTFPPRPSHMPHLPGHHQHPGLINSVLLPAFSMYHILKME